MRRLTAKWTRLHAASSPVARSSHGISAIKNRAFMFGGEATARSAISSDVHRLDPQASRWDALQGSANQPLPRVGHAQCSARDKLLVFGGRTDVVMGEGELNDLWAFDPATNSWEELTTHGTPPTARSFHRAASVADKLYIFGGCGHEGRLADLHELCLETMRWTAMPSPDVAGRGGATFEATPDGRSLWMCAGFAGHETNDLMRFDLATHDWHRAPSDWLRPRSVCASWSMAHPSGPVLLIYGGEVSPSDHGHEGAGDFASDLLAIDPATGAPIQLSVEEGPAPMARGWAAATALSPTEGVLHGGLSGSDAEPLRLDDTWLLSIGEPMAYNRMV